MFDHHYLGMYLTVAAVIALGAVISLAIYARQRRNAQTHQSDTKRLRWSVAAEEAPP